MQIETYLSKSTNALFLWVRRPFCFDWNAKTKTKTSGFLPKNTRYFCARVLIFISAVQTSVLDHSELYSFQPLDTFLIHGLCYTFITKSKGSTECKFT